jgi:hypothetical protein
MTEQADIEAAGPDPREWRADPDLWGYVEDLHAIDALIEAIGITSAGPDSAVHRSALEFLRSARGERRELLCAYLLALYGIELTEEQPGPFAAMGKARAFGAEHGPEARQP